MASRAFEEIVGDFEFLDDWEDRYRYVIDYGRAMQALDDALKVPSTKVEGCASQVWLHPRIEAGRFSFDGDSDAMIVRGLIAVLRALYNDIPVTEVGRQRSTPRPSWRGWGCTTTSRRSARMGCVRWSSGYVWLRPKRREQVGGSAPEPPRYFQPDEFEVRALQTVLQVRSSGRHSR